MAAPPEDQRPPMAVAMEWVSKITTVAVMMVLPAFAGYWADSRWGTDPWFLIIGASLGFATALLQLTRMVNGAGDRKLRGRELDADREGPKK